MLPHGIKKIAIDRLELIPEDVKVSICSQGVYSKEELIEHVKKEDRIGKKLIKIISEYIKFISK